MKLCAYNNLIIKTNFTNNTNTEYIKNNNIIQYREDQIISNAEVKYVNYKNREISNKIYTIQLNVKKSFIFFILLMIFITVNSLTTLSSNSKNKSKIKALSHSYSNTKFNSNKSNKKSKASSKYNKQYILSRNPSSYSNIRHFSPLYNPTIYFPHNRLVRASSFFHKRYNDNLYYDNQEDFNKKLNCNEICQTKHSLAQCNLGIIAGESINPVEYSFLTCSCISDFSSPGVSSNIFTYNEWCFNVFGCYRAVKGRCLESKKQVVNVSNRNPHF